MFKVFCVHVDGNEKVVFCVQVDSIEIVLLLC